MNRNKKLLSDTIIYTIGNFGSKIVSILMLKFYSNHLTTSEYGTIDILTTTVSLLMPLISLQLSDSAFRMLIDEKSKNEKIKYISSMFNFLLMNFVLVIFIVIIGKKILYRMNNQYIKVVILMIITGILYEVILQVIRGLNKTKIYASLGVLFTFIFTSMNIYLIGVLDYGIIGYLSSQIVAYVVTGVTGIIVGKLYKYYSFNIYLDKLKEMLNYSIPLIPNIMCWWILNVSDRYFLIYFCNSADVGLYAFALKITNLMYIVNAIFMLAWQSNSIQNYKKDDRNEYYSKVFYFYSIIQSFIVLGFSISSQLLVNLFGSKEYIMSSKFIPLLALGILFNNFATYYANNYIILKRTTSIMKTTLIAAIINTIVNIVLIPKIGVYGAIISTVVSYFIVWIIRVLDKSIEIRISLNINIMLINITSVILACIVATSNINNIFKFTINTIVIFVFIIVNLIFINSRRKRKIND